MQDRTIHYIIKGTKENIGCEPVKKQTKKKTKTQEKTYRLDDYRDRRENTQKTTRQNYDNPYQRQANSVNKVSDNPYRNTYQRPVEQRQRTTPKRTTRPVYEETRYYEEPVRELSPEEKRVAIKKNNKITRQEAQRKRKRQRRYFVRWLVMVGCIVMFASYGIIKCIDWMRYPSISYQVVQEGVIDNSKEWDGLIIRNEEVVMSPRDGNVHYIIGEGERVAKGGQVCFVANDIEVSATLQDRKSVV